MAQWYPIYDDTTKDVEGAGFFAEPESIEPGAGKSLGEGQPGDIPNDLVDMSGESAVYNYTYNEGNNQVEPKA